MPPQVLAFLQNLPGFDFIVNAWLFLKVLFIAADIALLTFFLIAFYYGWKMRPHLELHGHGSHAGGGHDAHGPGAHTLAADAAQGRWREIRNKASQGGVDALRLGILEADMLLDEVLAGLGSQGAHLADRLAAFDPKEVRSLEGVWRAHRLRNDLVHTPGFTAAPEEMEQALQDFEAFLKEIGTL